MVAITLAAQTSRNAGASVLCRLKRLKVNVIGVAVNETYEAMSGRHYYHGLPWTLRQVLLGVLQANESVSRDRAAYGKLGSHFEVGPALDGR